MLKSAMMPDALPHRGTTAPSRIAIGLALAASAGVMLWGVGTHCVAASEFARNAAQPPMTLEDRVAAQSAELDKDRVENDKLRENPSDTSEELSHFRASLANAETGLAARSTTDGNEADRHDTAAQIASNLAQLELRAGVLAAELAQIKAENAKLRESQSDTSEELSHIRASLANTDIGLAALRTTTEENEAHRRDTAAQIASNLAQLRDETLHLRMTQDDTATEIGSLRAGVANSVIGVNSLRTTTGEIRQRIERVEAARDATGSIPKSHKHQGQKKWVAQR